MDNRPKWLFQSDHGLVGNPSPRISLALEDIIRFGLSYVRIEHPTEFSLHLSPRFPNTRPLTAKRGPVWLALLEDRPLAAFAGAWTAWTSVRKVKEGEVTADLFGFLTCEPNADVAPIHPKAMPVILTKAKEIEIWLTADAPAALQLQRPLPDKELRIVASGEPKTST